MVISEKCKKTILLVYLVVFLLFETVGGFLITPVAAATVNVPEDYSTIQEAINAANPGDTIIVAPGTYPEQIIVNKTVSLIGEDNSAIIEGDSTGLPGVVYITADHVVFIGFTVQNGLYGVRLNCSDGTTVSGNVVSAPSFTGVLAIDCVNVTISHNTITGGSSTHMDGIMLIRSNSSLIKSNTIADVQYSGIGLTTSHDNVIIDNTLTSNKDGLTATSDSEGNSIYHNDFIDNTVNQAWDAGTNTWDNGYPSGGNYWSDYDGVDNYSGPNQNESGSDGIGDTPYVITGTNQDNYPFMNPCSQNDADSGGDAGDHLYAATPIYYSGSYSGYADSDLDSVDYYRFSVNSGQNIYITMTPTEGQDFDLHLYSPMGGSPIQSSEKTADATEGIVFPANTTGTWRMLINSSSGYGEYSLTLSVETPQNDANSFGTTLFHDDFNDRNYNEWTVVNGSWSATNQYLSSSGSGEEAIGTGDIHWRDYIVTVDVRVINGNDIAIDFLWDSGYWYGMRTWDNYSHLLLYRFAYLGYEEIARANLTGIDSAAWHTWKIVISNKGNQQNDYTAIKLFIDNELKIDYTALPVIFCGKIKLRVINGTIHFDNVNITRNGDAGDSFNTATFISPANYTGYIDHATGINPVVYRYAPHDTMDHYNFSVNSGQIIEVTMTPPSGLDLDLWLYNPSGNSKASSRNRGDATEGLTYTAVSSGNWSISIFIWHSYGTGEYDFTVSVETPQNDANSFGTTLFSDGFDDGSIGAWYIVSGNWSEQNGYVNSSGIGMEALATNVAGDLLWTDYFVQVDVQRTNGTDIAVDFLWNDTNKDFWYRMQIWGYYEKLVLVKMYNQTAEIWDLLAEARLTGIDKDAWHTWKIVLSNEQHQSGGVATIKLFIDEKLWIVYSDNNSPYMNGKVRLRTHNSTARYDNFIITRNGDVGDSFNTATLISPGSYTGYADPANDPHDWYQFQAVDMQTISITMTPPSGQNFDLYLYNPSGGLVDSSTNSGDATESIQKLVPIFGAGYWRMVVNATPATGSGNYSFTLSVTSPTSCPYLYVWDGTEFVFMSDVLAPSGLAYPDISLRYDFRPPNPHDFMVVPGEMLQAVNGYYIIELAEHTGEISYIDAIRLIAVDHPIGYDIYSPTVTTQIPLPFEYRTVSNPMSPITATKCDYFWGYITDPVDILDAILTPDDLNYAVANVDEFHVVELDFGYLGDLADISEFKLIIRGWMTFGDDPIGEVLWIQQHPETARAPYIEVINENGEWEAVGEPICNESFWEGHGMPRTMVRDIRHWLKSSDYRFRLHYWGGFHLDWIAVDITDTPLSQTTFTILRPTVADLYYKGGVKFIPIEGDVLGYYPALPDWDISHTYDTELFAGYFTRYGNVKPLLLGSDDMFVIMNYGDSIHLAFPEVPVPEGMERNYYLFVDGYFKLPYVKYFLNNTVSTVDPLPFHSMTTYPYGENESYPDDPIHRIYMRYWNTRYVGPENGSGEEGSNSQMETTTIEPTRQLDTSFFEFVATEKQQLDQTLINLMLMDQKIRYATITIQTYEPQNKE